MPADHACPSWDGLDVLVLAPTPTHPLDAGNRLRIYQVNQALQRRGARISYLHYPAEGDWRVRVPLTSVREMQAQWNACHIVPPTRPLHPAALGADHLIDEWWDPAIGDMLAWLFRTHRFDVFIVNYAWLSKAFSFCPPAVLKILDTHDRMSGRRALLQRHGIAAEFFHTDEEQERIALRRADIVWSIKEDEARFFRTLASGRVVNLPYAAPMTEVARRPPGAVLRFGLVGAANSINLVNFEAFLLEAEDYILHTLLPCEIVVAGSICDLLAHAAHGSRRGWLRLMGRIANIGDFYRAVDVVLAPITFSTGLKIKVGEALCHGCAVIAMEHAFEGFWPLHPFHGLTSLRAMMRACRDIVNDPPMIRTLEELSIRSVAETQAEAERGLDASIAALWNIEPGVCVVVDAADLFRGSLVLDHVCELAHRLGEHTAVNIFVGGEALGSDAADALALLAQCATLVLAPALLSALGSEAGALLGVRVLRSREFGALLEEPQRAFWFASCPQHWPALKTRRPVPAYVAADSILLCANVERWPQLLDALGHDFEELVMLSRDASAAAGPCRRQRLTLLGRGDHSLALAELRARRPDGITILADALDDPLLALTVALVLRLCDRRIDVVLPAYGIDRPVAADWLEPPRVTLMDLAHCFRPRSPAGPRPVLILDLATDARFAGVREVFERLPAATVRLFATPDERTAWRPDLATGLFESALLIEHLLACPEPAFAPAADPRADADWNRVLAEMGGRVAAA